MRSATFVTSAVAALLLVSAPAWCQQEQQKPSQSEEQKTAAQDQSAKQTQTAAPAKDPLAEAARKAREAHKRTTKAPVVFDNDNMPSAGGVSYVGPQGAGPGDADTGAGASASGKTQSKAGSKAGSNDEQTWRAKFATLRHKLQQDQAELDIMQRELGVLNVQYYSDPNKQMQQQLSRDDINKKTAAIEQKKKDVAADQEAISDAEDALRKSGGDPGWASPQ